MRAVLLSPHNDDETLFAAFTCLRYKPFVIVCLRSYVQEKRRYGISHAMREQETEAAMKVLGCDWAQWSFSDLAPPWPDIAERIAALDVDTIFAPYPEGHEHHQRIGQLALDAHSHKVRFYATYTERGKSIAVGKQVEIEDDWALLKLRALSCYASQASHPTTREHFIRDQHEYVT